MFLKSPFIFVVKLTCMVAMVVSPSLLLADSFNQINLVSDVSGLASVTDPNLVNPWGVAFSATSPFWVSNQGSGTATLYNGTGAITPLVVSVPGSNTPPSGPTGQVFNANTDFVLPDGTGAKFIFDTLNGTIAGWNGGTSAVTMVSTPGAVYTGLAIGNNGAADYLYAADSTGQIRVFNSSFAAASLSGNFADPNAIAGYVPFNIQELNGKLYVTYAQLTPQGAALSGGYVDEFDNNGNFIQRVATGGSLFAPWGITIAPQGFGDLGGDYLIGNFGNGEILEYSPTGAFLGTLDGSNGNPIVNQNLWALDFRTGGTGVNTDALYFTAGIDNQQEGLFGELVPTPEPSTLFLFGASGLVAGLSLRRRSRRREQFHR